MKIETIRKRMDKVEIGRATGPFEVELSDIQIDPTMQVRDRMDKGNLHRLRSAYRAGSEVPPLLLAFVGTDDQHLFVIDGHHRFTTLELLAAEARHRGGKPVDAVQAMIVKLSPDEARYQAAIANNAHGLQLKSKESRRVFATYVRAGRHRTLDGFKSYREIAKEMGRDHKTIAAWMRSDFPAEATRMGEPEKATEGGDGPPRPIVMLKHEIDAWLLEGRNLFDQGRSGDRSGLVEGMERLVEAFKANLASEDWDGLIPGIDVALSRMSLPSAFCAAGQKQSLPRVEMTCALHGGFLLCRHWVLNHRRIAGADKNRGRLARHVRRSRVRPLAGASVHPGRR
ncbi:ParB N-terminal domain-containing protein [Metarhizobium album]|nr:ParB N-terminal domain-containing protein [Rhizobium album]